MVKGRWFHKEDELLVEVLWGIVTAFIITWVLPLLKVLIVYSTTLKYVNLSPSLLFLLDLLNNIVLLCKI